MLACSTFIFRQNISIEFHCQNPILCLFPSSVTLLILQILLSPDVPALGQDHGLGDTDVADLAVAALAAERTGREGNTDHTPGQSHGVARVRR